MTVRPIVVADVDTGIDDALALTYLAHLHRSGDISLKVTTSAGNCTAEQAAANSAEVLAAAGVDVPVQAGAPVPQVVPLVTTPETHGSTGLGYHVTQAAGCEASVERAVDLWEGADFILIAGPATNLAWAAQRRPEVLSTARIVLMTGAFDYPGNTTPTAEWNAWVDPHALRTALELVPNLTLCPLNVTEQVLLTPERAHAWGNQLLEDALRFYFEFHEQVGVGYVAQIHDLAAAMVLLRTVDCVVGEERVGVEVDGDRRGTTTSGAGHPAAILRELNPADVFTEFERSLAASGDGPRGDGGGQRHGEDQGDRAGDGAEDLGGHNVAGQDLFDGSAG